MKHFLLKRKYYYLKERKIKERLQLNLFSDDISVPID